MLRGAQGKYLASRWGGKGHHPIVERLGRRESSSLSPYLSIPRRRLCRAIKAEGCTALLCDDYEHACFDLCVLLGRLLKIPVFATFQGGSRDASRLTALIRPVSIRSCSGLIIGSHAEQARVQRQYGLPPNRVASIPNAVEPSEFEGHERITARRLVGVQADAKIAAWHGRVDLDMKGVDVLIDAWVQVCEARAGQSLYLLMVGGGPHGGEIRRRLNRAGVHNVTWLNRFETDRSVLRTYLRAADVYAFPSRWEGFPVAPLEAMASGLAVVASDVLGMAEILGTGPEPAGVRVPVGDVSAFAEALGRALDDLELSHAMGLVAQRRVAAYFSLETLGPALRSFLFGGQSDTETAQ